MAQLEFKSSGHCRLQYLPYLLLALCLFCGFSLQSPARSLEKDREALLQLENRWLQSERDPEALQSILAEDFVHALPTGFITKDDQIGFVRAHKGPPDGHRRSFKDIRVRVYQDAGIVNGIVVETDQAGTTVQKTVFTDVFVFRENRWQAVNAQENPFQPRP